MLHTFHVVLLASLVTGLISGGGAYAQFAENAGGLSGGGLFVDRTQQAGRHEVLFRASSLPSGTYFYRLRAGSYQEVRAVTLVK